MPLELMDTTFDFKRPTKSGQNTIGEITKTFPYVYQNVPGRLERSAPVTRTGMMEYRDSGQRKKYLTIIYIPVGYTIIQEDQVYNGGNYIGLVKGVSPAKSSIIGAIDHWELSIEEP